MKHPIQPLAPDENGVMRFKENAIVQFLLKNGGYDLNDLARMGFSQEDEEQFAQLTGYSLSGFGDAYAGMDTYETAQRMADEGLTETEARIAYLQETLDGVRERLRELVPLVFHVAPEDLQA